jgi:dTDP-4-amino-4,6-dideoxygalactose transaminase
MSARPAPKSALPAIAGGTPVRATLLPLARPSLGAEEEHAVLEVMRSGWVSSGPLTEKLERGFAEMLGVAHAVAVSSCTAGLHLLLRAAGVGPGDEVITSPMTFPATANAILHAGARPVIADVVAGRLTLDPSAVRAAITPATKAVVAVHLAGWPTDMAPLADAVRAAGAIVLEDAAHALGATYRGRPAGTLAQGAAFSFYATKNMTTGEGGMAVTSDAGWAERMSAERLHGLDLDASKRRGAAYRHWEAVRLGFKYNLNDIAAAIGVAQLAKLPVMLERRRALYARYREALRDEPAVEWIDGPPDSVTAAHLCSLLLRTSALRVGRDDVLAALLAENVGVGVHFRALPLHRFFRDDVGMRAGDVPVAVDASHRTLTLPLFPDMTDADVDDAVEALVRVLRYFAA